MVSLDRARPVITNRIVSPIEDDLRPAATDDPAAVADAGNTVEATAPTFVQQTDGRAIAAANEDAMRLHLLSGPPTGQTTFSSGRPARTFTLQGFGGGVTSDAAVSDAVDRAVHDISRGATPAALTEIFENPDLTRNQRNEAVARILQMADGEGQLSEIEASFMLDQLNDIGLNANADSSLHEDLRKSISASVYNGTLDGEDLFNLIQSHGPGPGSQGLRELMTRVGDSDTLVDVSERLMAEADRQGYDAATAGASTLIAAADLANMAMLRGDDTAAHAFLDRYDELRADGIMDQMMQVGELSPFANGIDSRSGANVLATLAGRGDAIQGVDDGQSDRFFADVVRGLDEVPMPPGQSNVLEDGTRRLAGYFERNADRLIEQDWRLANSGSHPESYYHGLTQSVVENILLHDDFDEQKKLVSVLSDQLHQAAATMGNTDLSYDERSTAAQSFGTIMGSLRQGSENYISNARGEAQQQIGAVRTVTDLLTDELISWSTKPLGPAGQPVNSGAEAAVNAVWQAVEDQIVEGAERRLDTRFGGIDVLMEVVRGDLQDIDGLILDSLDGRESLYHPPR